MLPYRSHYNGKVFSNPVPTEMMKKGGMLKMFRDFFNKPPDHQPSNTPGPFSYQPSEFPTPEPDRLRVTWLGHSSTLIEIGGKRLLTDPVWYERASPFRNLGPKRFFEVPIPLEHLPPVDCILLSHDHYDHLDRKTMLYLLEKKIPVITMLKVGDRLKNWGADPSLITELDWWQSKTLDQVVVTALPARHFSGRWLNDRFSTLWGSFAITSPYHRVYFGADSGYYEGFRFIGEEFGPFDLTLLDSGAYNELWKYIHMGPENALLAHQDLKGKLLMPIHWGTFSLAMHPWTEPVERIISGAETMGVELLLPRPGQPTDALKPYNSGWWKGVDRKE